jgi:tetratricopeptide (TPR) repeat protein
MTEAIRLSPRDADLRRSRADFYEHHREFGKALADRTDAITLAPDSSSAQLELAWMLATCPDAAYRNGKRAVGAATRACELTNGKDANVLDTLAAALAEVGDFEGAIQREQDALGLLPQDSESRREFETRLARYKAGRPYREDAPAR